MHRCEGSFATEAALSAIEEVSAGIDPNKRFCPDALVSNHINIIISERDMFDYSSGEPPNHVLTVLRALEVQSLAWIHSAA